MIFHSYGFLMKYYFLILLLQGQEHVPQINRNFLIEIDSNEERPNDTDNDYMEHFTNTNSEGGDKSDDPQDMNFTVFPKSSLK